MSKKLIISARTWKTFVESLKANLKHNFGICEKTSFKSGYYTSILVSGTDHAYIARLNSVTGEEKENCIDLVDYLSGAITIEVSDEPLPEKVVQEIKSAIVDYAVTELSKEAVVTKIKRPTRSKK